MYMVDRFNHWYDNLKEPKRVLACLGFVLPVIIFYNLGLHLSGYWFYGVGVYFLLLLLLRYRAVWSVLCRPFH